MVTPWVGRGPFRGRGPFKGRGPFAGQGSPFGRLTGSVWTPANLFAASEPGAWYDPSDLTTLFQDAAGTTPVTAVEQPVGLMLDKSRGLVLGSDVVVNGDFASGANWVTQAGWAISGGSSNGTATNNYLYQVNANIVVNGYYEITFTVSNYSAGTVQPYLGATVTLGTIVSGNGTFTQKLSPTTNGNELGFKGNGFTGSIDNVVIKRVPGNHASQSTTTSRPVLSARKNLLANTETLSTQNVTVRAVQHVLSFWGTGSVTLSGTSTGTLSGTGVNDRVYVAFTPTAGTLTLTVSGSVTQAQLEEVREGA